MIVLLTVKYYSEATFIRCDVLNWDEQVSMFELALSQYGSVDIVVRRAHSSDFIPTHGYYYNYVVLRLPTPVYSTNPQTRGLVN